jgi:hypothetical protein
MQNFYDWFDWKHVQQNTSTNTNKYLKNPVFRYITPFKKSFACGLFHANFLFGLAFYPDNEGEMSFRSIGLLSRDYTELYPWRHNSL